MRIFHYIKISILILAVLAAGVYVYWYYFSTVAIDFTVVELVDQPVIYLDDEIEGNAAIVYDTKDTSIYFGKNIYIPYPLASLTKIVAAMVAKAHVTDRTIFITQGDTSIDSRVGSLEEGDEWDGLDLLRYSLMTSSNQGFNAINRSVIRATGSDIISLMKAFTLEHQLPSLYFANPTGLDINERIASSKGSVYDVAKILTLFHNEYPTLAEITNKQIYTFKTVAGREVEAKNTNKLLTTNEDILVSKTGYTDLAGGNLAILLDSDTVSGVAIVVLGSSISGRFSDMETLIGLVEQYMQENTRDVHRERKTDSIEL